MVPASACTSCPSAWSRPRSGRSRSIAHGDVRMMYQPRLRAAVTTLAFAFVAGCASAPPPPPEVRPRAQRTYEQKMEWILRLEEDRVLELPLTPAPPPPAPVPVAPARGRTAPPVVI